jgi:hypothetical protein
MLRTDKATKIALTAETNPGRKRSGKSKHFVCQIGAPERRRGGNTHTCLYVRTALGSCTHPDEIALRCLRIDQPRQREKGPNRPQDFLKRWRHESKQS